MRSRSQKPTATDRAIEGTIGAEESTEMSKEAHVQGHPEVQAAQAKVDQAQKELEETKQRVAAQYDKEHPPVAPTDWSPDQKARIQQITAAVTPPAFRGPTKPKW